MLFLSGPLLLLNKDHGGAGRELGKIAQHCQVNDVAKKEDGVQDSSGNTEWGGRSSQSKKFTCFHLSSNAAIIGSVHKGWGSECSHLEVAVEQQEGGVEDAVAAGDGVQLHVLRKAGHIVRLQAPQLGVQDCLHQQMALSLPCILHDFYCSVPSWRGCSGDRQFSGFWPNRVEKPKRSEIEHMKVQLHL